MSESSSPLQAGALIMVDTFSHRLRLPVKLLSSESIDQGASASIYKGLLMLPRHSYKVALKVFPSILSRDKAEMLRRELRSASTLYHRWILPFTGTAEFGFHTIIVAPFMRHGNLLQYFTEVPTADRQRMVIQVAEAVHFLHECVGLVHGDLKCENVLVSDEGDARLADFGLSTVVEQEESSTTTMTAIRQQNTLRFAAPELLLGTDDPEAEPRARPRSKTTASDVYAFGMLILQAFTGKKPWPNLRNEAVMWKVFSKAVPPHPGDQVTTLGLTSKWWDVCLKCWKFRPAERPTMFETWNQLQASISRKRCFGGHSECVSTAIFMPCGRRIASGSHDKTINILDADSGEVLVGPMIGHSDFVRCVVASPDGEQLASSSDDCTIRLWDASTGAQIGDPLTGHTEVVWSIAFHCNRGYIVSGSQDKTVRLWTLLRDPPSWVSKVMTEHDSCVWTVAFSPDGSSFASGSRDGTIRLWDLSGACLTTILAHTEVVSAVSFLPGGNSLISASWDSTVRIWDTSTGSSVWPRFPEHLGAIFSLAVDPSGKHVAAACLDNTIRVWNIKSGEPVGAAFTGHDGTLFSISFSTDGNSLVFGGHVNTIRIWDIFA